MIWERRIKFIYNDYVKQHPNLHLIQDMLQWLGKSFSLGLERLIIGESYEN